MTAIQRDGLRAYATILKSAADLGRAQQATATEIVRMAGRALDLVSIPMDLPSDVHRRVAMAEAVNDPGLLADLAAAMLAEAGE